MKEKYDLILFDVDGTLTDSGEGITKSVQYTLEKYGIIEPDLNNLRKFIGPPLIDSFMKFRKKNLYVPEIFSMNAISQLAGWKIIHMTELKKFWKNCRVPAL